MNNWKTTVIDPVFPHKPHMTIFNSPELVANKKKRKKYADDLKSGSQLAILHVPLSHLGSWQTCSEQRSTLAAR